MGQALIEHGVLLELFEESALEAEEFAKKVGVKVERVEQWLEGLAKPTFKQAEKIARVLQVPFGYLFLKQLPKDDIKLPDLRTVGGVRAADLDKNFQDLLKDVLFKHDWFVDFREEIGFDPLPFVGRFTVESSSAVVAQDIAQTLDLTHDHRLTNGNWEDFLNLLITKAEQAGVWVMRSGVVGNSTNRTLSVEQFRGFAISHNLAPLVFLNGRDAKAAQIFSLAHELAHVWLGESGVSNSNILRAENISHQQIEAKCNAIAAEFLTPEDLFQNVWRADQSLDVNADTISREFKVSPIVGARRAFDLGFVSRAEYQAFAKAQQERWASRQESSGGNFYATVPVRNGKVFTQSVISQALSGRVLLRNAARLLNVKPASVIRLGQV